MLKKLKMVYNPFAGDKSFKLAIDACVDAFQSAGYETHLYRTQAPEDTDGIVVSLAGCDYDALVVAGGDGTVNQAVNALMRDGRPIPLGVIPAGTANDFAGYLKMPAESSEAARALIHGRLLKSDLGRVNGRYFINVCGAGLFTNISHQVDAPLKDSLGKLAYYLKGIEQLPRFVPFPVRVTTPEAVWEDMLYLFIALNGGGAGGFNRLCPYARIDDGLLDFIAVKAVSLRELAMLLVTVLKGEMLQDESVIYFRTPQLTVEAVETAEAVEPVEVVKAVKAVKAVKTAEIVENRSNTPPSPTAKTDVDGEQGPDMPVRIECVPDAITLFVPDTYR